MLERVNGTLVKILRTLVVENPSEWDIILPLAVFAYNTVYNITIRDCPHILFHTDLVVAYHIFLEYRSTWYNIVDFKAK